MPRHIEPLTINPTPEGRGWTPHPDDVTATLDGLRGVYLSADLYARYRDVATEAGRHPATITRFGRALTAAGFQRRRNTAGTARCWIIEPS